MSFRYPKGGFIQLFFDPLTPGPVNNFGPLYAWGANATFGQLGLNDTVSRSSPVQVGSDANWVQMASNNANTAGIKNDGTLWMWGANNTGQLGQNNAIAASSPVQVGALTNWAKVVLGSGVLAVKTDGTMWSWGTNTTGQLGQNDRVARSSPVQIGSDTNWASISAAQNNGFFAIKTTGTLYSWGADVYGNLGLNDTGINRSSPTQVGALTNWASVSNLSDYWSIAVKTDGTLWSWGNNSYGQLGANTAPATLPSRSSPVQVGALTNWSKVAGAADSAVSIKTDGTIWTWGRNNNGQLGDSSATTAPRSSPAQLGALTTWSQVAGGDGRLLALKTDGTLWGWGSSINGELGQNDTVSRSSPIQIGSSTNWAPGFSVYSSVAAPQTS